MVCTRTKIKASYFQHPTETPDYTEFTVNLPTTNT